MSKILVRPLGRISIRSYALKIRTALGYRNTDYINAPKLYDKLALLLANEGFVFDYRVMPDNSEIFEYREEAYTDIATGVIYIKESVMEQACKKRYKRGTFTLIHELGHYLLHYLQDDAKLTRVSDYTEVPAYRDPEWQADTFASEFLMPFGECLNLDVEQIRKTYHVSRSAAEVRYEIIQIEKMKKAK